LQRSQREPEVLILKMRQVLAMDAHRPAGARRFAARLRRRGKHLLLCGRIPSRSSAMERHGFIDWLWARNGVWSRTWTIAAARRGTSAAIGLRLLNQPVCDQKASPQWKVNSSEPLVSFVAKSR
jgi:hypothetical protein